MSLRDDLIRDEGRRRMLYRCPAGKLTGGVGHNFDDNGIPEPIIDALLDYDIGVVNTELAKHLPWLASRPESIRRALGNMAFQLGMPKLLQFTKMLRALEIGDYAGAKKEALDSNWAKQTPERAQRVTELFTDE